MTFEEFWQTELSSFYGDFKCPAEPFFTIARMTWVKAVDASSNEADAFGKAVDNMIRTLDTVIGDFKPF